ncbi:hypothetical protein [Bacillus cereus]|uniref:hypothetical protein n=1 Tax=Bacillus cereus TaxID=1396 RepID=UPI0035CD34AA
MEKSIISLSNVIEEWGGDVDDYLRSFKCEVNDSIESYLHNKAILHEREDAARTSLLVEEATSKIIGYFTLNTKIFEFTTASGNNRKRLAGNKGATSFVTMLIAKLGRSDEFKGIVPGQEVLEAALYNCSIIKELSATKIVCVEYNDKQFLKCFYEEQNGFTLLQRNQNGLNCSFIKI